jgi:hypothetical protein
MTRRFAAALVAVLALTLAPTPAHADSRVVRDGYGASAAALDVRSGSFSYGERTAVIRVRFEDLRRRRTMLVVKYLRRDRTTIQVATRFVGGDKQVLVHRSDPDSYRRLRGAPVAARWDFDRDVVTVVIRRPLLRGRVAGFYAWSQPKHAQHGAPAGHDDLYVPRLRRG